MKLTDRQLTNAVRAYIYEADADALAHIAGEVFGGKCFFLMNDDSVKGDLIYDFEPNENYCGEFDDIESGEADK